jgi:hypothetical protein
MIVDVTSTSKAKENGRSRGKGTSEWIAGIECLFSYMITTNTCLHTRPDYLQLAPRFLGTVVAAASH